VTVTYNDGADPTAAAAAAKTADVAIVMVGNKDREGADRPDLSLPDNQDALVFAIASANARTVVVLKTGGAVLMPWIARVSAVLEAWYPGEEDGNVVADLLFGVTNPSGKLPVSFPRIESEVPANTREQYPGVNGTAVYSEKLQVGYRWYDAQQVPAMLPFGYGLSYTTFKFSNFGIVAKTLDTVAVSMDLVNSGDREGAEIAQVYVAAPPGAGEPPRQLKGFAKVTLKPGESKRVTIPLDPRAFEMWDVSAKRWVHAAGPHEILVGDSSRNLIHTNTITINPNSR
jgi:beta-glucosidase